MGSIPFYRSIDNSENRTGPSGTFLRPTQHYALHPHVSFNQIEIECITLDSWFEEQNIDYIDFAWTDVNGSEIALLQGGINTFKATKYLQLECIPYELWENQPTKDQLLELLPDFVLEKEENHDILLINKNI